MSSERLRPLGQVKFYHCLFLETNKLTSISEIGKRDSGLQSRMCTGKSNIEVICLFMA